MNLKVKETLSKLLSFALTAQDMKSATLGTGVTGFAYYIQVGRMVTIHGVISTSATKAAGSVLLTGFPKPLRGWTVGNFTPLGTSVGFYVNDQGQIRNESQLAATSNLRFAYSYIAQ